MLGELGLPVLQQLVEHLHLVLDPDRRAGGRDKTKGGGEVFLSCLLWLGRSYFDKVGLTCSRRCFPKELFLVQRWDLLLYGRSYVMKERYCVTKLFVAAKVVLRCGRSYLLREKSNS